MTNKRSTIAILLAIFIISACGRREHRAFFDAVSPKEAPPSLARPLPQSALQVRWSSTSLPLEVTAGVLLPIAVILTNIGDTTWPDKIMADPKQHSGRNAVRLSYSFNPITPSGTHPRAFGGERVDLPKPVVPGESVTLEIIVRIPDQPGNYQFTSELLQECVVWFYDLGADTLTMPVRVVPLAAAATPRNTQSVPPR